MSSAKKRFSDMPKEKRAELVSILQVAAESLIKLDNGEPFTEEENTELEGLLKRLEDFTPKPE